jgi:hypothetical protein
MLASSLCVFYQGRRLGRRMIPRPPTTKGYGRAAVTTG